MSDSSKMTISKRENAEYFAKAFLKGYLEPAFGARSKSEIDLLVFACLIEAKVIDPDTPIYEIARGLNITPNRVRNLVLNWQLRSTSASTDLRQSIIDALKKTRFSKDGTLLAFGVESPLLREEIIARLRRKGVFADASFAKELVKLPVETFVEFLDDVLDDDTKKAIRTALVRDKQLPDKSFKALAVGILKKLGEKVADKAGGAVAEQFVDKASGFLTGLLTGDTRAATRNISRDDFVEA